MHQNEWLTPESRRESARETFAALRAALRGFFWSAGLTAALLCFYLLESAV